MNLGIKTNLVFFKKKKKDPMLGQVNQSIKISHKYRIKISGASVMSKWFAYLG